MLFANSLVRRGQNSQFAGIGQRGPRPSSPVPISWCPRRWRSPLITRPDNVLIWGGEYGGLAADPSAHLGWVERRRVVEYLTRFQPWCAGARW